MLGDTGIEHPLALRQHSHFRGDPGRGNGLPAGVSRPARGVSVRDRVADGRAGAVEHGHPDSIGPGRGTLPRSGAAAGVDRGGDLRSDADPGPVPVLRPAGGAACRGDRVVHDPGDPHGPGNIRFPDGVCPGLPTGSHRAHQRRAMGAHGADSSGIGGGLRAVVGSAAIPAELPDRLRVDLGGRDVQRGAFRSHPRAAPAGNESVGYAADQLACGRSRVPRARLRPVR